MGAERRESPAILAVKHSWCHGLPKHVWHHHLHLHNEDIDERVKTCDGPEHEYSKLKVVMVVLQLELLGLADAQLGLLAGSQAKQEQEVRSITINFLRTFTHEWSVWG